MRSRALGGNVVAGLRSIVCGEIKEYTQLLEEARRHCADMLAQKVWEFDARDVTGALRSRNFQ